MANSFLKVIPELIEANLLTAEKGEEIRQYFEQKTDKSQGRLIVVFGILGSLLIGLGIILIIAHNWDNFSKEVRSLFAFLPLIVAQVISVFVIVKKTDSIVWRESAAAFLFFAVGISISLISQIYHIPGNLSSFLLTWMLLCLPVVYLLGSTSIAVFVIIGATFYACETSYWSRYHEFSWGYWIIMLLAIPHYFRSYQKHKKSNFVVLLSWLVPISVTISLGTLANGQEEFMFVTYMSWFGVCLFAGLRLFGSEKNILTNAYTSIGWLGTMVLLLMLSFDWFWNELIDHEFALWSVEFAAATVVTAIAIALLLSNRMGKTKRPIQLVQLVFVFFLLFFIVGVYTTKGPMIGVNLLILMLGLQKILQGARNSHLGMLNFGLIIITALILCRFFDADINFVLRGVLFVALGFSFFVSNYVLLKRRKKNEE